MTGENRSLCPHPIQEYLLTYLQWLSLLPWVVFITWMLSSKDALPYNQKTKWGREIMQQKGKSHCPIPQGIVDLMYQGHPYLCTNPNWAQGLTQTIRACQTISLFNLCIIQLTCIILTYSMGSLKTSTVINLNVNFCSL